jgi:hypothetical protein
LVVGDSLPGDAAVLPTVADLERPQSLAPQPDRQRHIRPRSICFTLEPL